MNPREQPSFAPLVIRLVCAGMGLFPVQAEGSSVTVWPELTAQNRTARLNPQESLFNLWCRDPQQLTHFGGRRRSKMRHPSLYRGQHRIVKANDALFFCVC